MSLQRVTVQVSAVMFGDQWLGSTVTGIANSWRPDNMDITLFDPAAQQSRTVTINRAQWFAVTRDV